MEGWLLSGGEVASALTLKRFPHPSGHLLVTSFRVERQLAGRLGSRSNICVLILGLFRDGGWLGERLDSGMGQQHRICVSFSRVFVQARPHKVARCIRVPLGRKIGWVTLHDGLLE
jgi:hypothetical protein